MIFLLDNYDSFTFNLYDYLAQLGSEVIVERNDKITIAQIEKLRPRAIVISPGPKTPREAGILMDLIAEFYKTLPLLGICLGYQGLGEYFGAELIRSPVPVHGKTSEIIFDTEDILFQHIPQHTQVMRYHSLNIQHIPPAIKLIAETTNGEPMAIKHRSYPLYGLQFHPESILTTDGFIILENWYKAFVSGSAVP